MGRGSQLQATRGLRIPRSITVKSIAEMSAAECRACTSLTFGPVDGTMLNDFIHARYLATEHGIDTNKVLMAKDTSRRIIAWASLLATKPPQLHVFVREDVRRQGLGSKLVREALKL